MRNKVLSIIIVVLIIAAAAYIISRKHTPDPVAETELIQPQTESAAETETATEEMEIQEELISEEGAMSNDIESKDDDQGFHGLSVNESNIIMLQTDEEYSIE